MHKSFVVYAQLNHNKKNIQCYLRQVKQETLDLCTYISLAQNIVDPIAMHICAHLLLAFSSVSLSFKDIYITRSGMRRYTDPNSKQLLYQVLLDCGQFIHKLSHQLELLI
jgi:hypothetical protein